jgi:hypothetical protein
MRLVTVTPDDKFNNLDRIAYICDCGATVENFVARKPKP